MTRTILPSGARCAIALVSLSLAALATDWTNRGGNAARNGLSNGFGPLTANVLWELPSGATVETAVCTEARRVYTWRTQAQSGPIVKQIVCRDLDSGAELWSTDLGLTGVGLGGVKDGQVYAGVAQKIVALDALSGNRTWTSLDDVAWNGDPLVFAPNGDPIAGTGTRFVRLRASSGATVWS